jgi:hypothetical protein
MKRLFLGNFDFEHWLAADSTHHHQLNEGVKRLQLELAALWPAVADEGDSIWLPTEVEAGFFEGLPRVGLPRVNVVSNPGEIESPVEACPWGWTDDVRLQCEEQGWRFSAPPQEIIRETNSRRFSLELEQTWGIGLEGATLVTDVAELATAVERSVRYAERWVLKAEFGMSARERILGRGSEPSEQATDWIQKRCQSGEAVVLEPWVERIEEVGLQYTVPWSAAPVFEGVTQLLCDESGQYRGSRFAQDVDTELRWMPAIETGMRVARHLKQLGYFGPLGIDAMRYRDHTGLERIRSVQDINARHTMGRLALGLRRVLQPGELGTWLHVRWPTESVEAPREWFDRLIAQTPAAVRIIRTSPLTVDQRPVGHGTLVLASADETALNTTESIAANV